MGVHDGHRQRMRDRFKEVGLEGFNDLNALELLLFYAVGRKDTNQLAHDLLKRFGSLMNVLEADHEELCSVEGVGDNGAILIRLITEMSRRYWEQEAFPRDPLLTTEDAGRYLTAKFMLETKELAYAILLDNGSRVICCKRLNKGVVNGTELDVRALVESAMKNKATAVIITHNHPHGVPIPSREDEINTKKLKHTLALVDVELLDHVIIGGNAYYSMKENKLM